MNIIKEKSETQRTVCRLTLLKGHNMGEPAAFARLLGAASPGFIEVKGATFAAWDAEETGLTMEAVPWYEEVLTFAQSLESELGGEYGIAAVHEHSCSVLLAKRSTFFSDQWMTWIDFGKFADNPDIHVSDFQVPTPDWATGVTQGFDPKHSRHRPPRRVVV